MSMIVIVPFYKETLSSVVNRLSGASIRRILNQLPREQEVEDLVVYLPKFKISSDLVLNEILYSMGMEEIFVPGAAALGGMSPDDLFISHFFHKAEIEVDEEGTTGTAAAVAGVVAISAPPTFTADRPFVYVIYDKVTKSIIFTGQVYNPNKN